MDISDILWPGWVLNEGDRLFSADGQFHLDLQFDGNLVLVDNNGNPRWAAMTQNQGPDRCIMQGDGNLVIYRNTDNAALWASGTQGWPGSLLRMQDDGNLVIYWPNWQPQWWTGPL